MEKEKAKKDALKGNGRAFLFMIVSILPISLIRRNNQGIIHNVAQIFLPQNGRLVPVYDQLENCNHEMHNPLC